MNVSGIISTIDSNIPHSSTHNNDESQRIQRDKVNKDFASEIGISKEMSDSAAGLINTFVTMDEVYNEHNAVVNSLNDEINLLDSEIDTLRNSIEALSIGIGNATNATERAQKIRERETLEEEKRSKEMTKSSKETERANRLIKRDSANLQREKANQKFNRQFGRDINLATDKAALGKKEASMMNITKGGLGGLKGNPWVALADMAVKAIEWGIGKAGEYAKLNAENLMRYLNTTTQVTLNSMKASVDSWQDAVEGAYTSQRLANDSLQSLLQAQNATTLANLKMSNTWTNWIPIWGAINGYEEQVLESEQKINETRLENAAKLIAQANEFTKKADEYIRKQDKTVHQYQTSIGLSSSQTNVFEKRMLSQGQTFAHYNKTIEDVIKYQTGYADESGRAINMTNSDYQHSMAAGRLIGDDNFTKISASMNIFNQSVESSAEIMYDMYKSANKMGLSTQKLTKNILGNIKMAEKYEFKGGIKGFVELSKWAENFKVTLSSLSAILDKSINGGLEGNITTAAKLQVLGGNFAMYADPLAMGWECLNDPEACADRIQKMFGDMGTVNQQTGATEFSGLETLRIKAGAEALGMSLEDAKNMIRATNKREVIKGQVSNSNLKKEEFDAVANNAQYNQKTGRWEVAMLDGTKKDVSEIKSSDMENMVSGNSDEDMLNYAKGTYSAVEKIEMATKQVAALLGAETFDDFITTTEKSTMSMVDAYTSHVDKIAEAIGTDRAESLKAQMEQFGALSTINTTLLDAYAEVAKQKADIAKIQQQLEKYLTQRKIDEEKHSQRQQNVDDAAANLSAGDFGAAWNYEKAKLERDLGEVSDAWYRGDTGEAIIKGTKNTLKRGLVDNFGAIGLANKVSHLLGYRGLDSLFDDGVVNANGNPITVGANKVTPIEDGNVQMAKSSPNDSAIFAKTGGPFDKLFNGVFNKVEDIYNTVSSSVNISNVTSNNSENSPIVSPIPLSMEFPQSSNNNNSFGYNPYQSSGELYKNRDFNLNIRGEIEIKSNGKSVGDLNDMLNNPFFIRSLSQLISKEMEGYENVGKPNAPF